MDMIKKKRSTLWNHIGLQPTYQRIKPGDLKVRCMLQYKSRKYQVTDKHTKSTRTREAAQRARTLNLKLVTTKSKTPTPFTTTNKKTFSIDKPQKLENLQVKH